MTGKNNSPVHPENDKIQNVSNDGKVDGSTPILDDQHQVSSTVPVFDGILPSGRTYCHNDQKLVAQNLNFSC